MNSRHTTDLGTATSDRREMRQNYAMRQNYTALEQPKRSANPRTSTTDGGAEDRF